MLSFFTAAALTASTLTSIVSAVPLAQHNARAVPGQNTAKIAVYYGQGDSQPRLSHFCDDADIDIIPIGFVNGFGNGQTFYWSTETYSPNNGWPSANFGNQCGGGLYVTPDGKQTNMFTLCTQLRDDVAYCQAKGKKILLSIGGDNQKSPYQFTSDAEGREFAEQVWGMFGDLQSDWGSKPRPFGSNSVDGFDLDLEMGGNTGYLAMAQRLRELMGSKLLTAAPQCNVPDSHLGQAIAAVRFDQIYVQFYNTQECSAKAGVDKIKGVNSGSDDISFKKWADYVRSLGQSPTPQIFIGLPGSTAAANNGFYVTPEEAQSLFNKFYTDSAFGGAMIWEATAAEANSDFTGGIKKALDECYCGPSGCKTTTTAATTVSQSVSTIFSLEV